MSEKEIAMQLINNLPDYKLGYVIRDLPPTNRLTTISVFLL